MNGWVTAHLEGRTDESVCPTPHFGGWPGRDQYGAPVSYRVVIPRSIPFSQSNRVQEAAWKRGYGTRLAGRDPGTPADIVVEFLKQVEELPPPTAVRAYEESLETVLTSKTVNAAFTGSGAWLETVREWTAKPGRTAIR